VTDSTNQELYDGYLPCGHLEIFMTISEDGPHCSKCGRSYVQWEKLIKERDAALALLDEASELLKVGFEAVTTDKNRKRHDDWLTAYDKMKDGNGPYATDNLGKSPYTEDDLISPNQDEREGE